MSVDIVKPIPNLDSERQVKESYHDYPIDSLGSVFEELLVPISDYGVDGVSYYSQQNNATIDPVPGVTPNIFVRKSVAEKLAATNDFLGGSSDVSATLGGPVSLYVRDGFRSPVLQAHLHDTVIPELLRVQNPDWSEEQVSARVGQVIASPKWSDTTMPPHFTGGAVDVILISTESGDILNTGFKSVHLGGEAIHTDFLEKISDNDLALAGLEQALVTRRVLHNVLTSDAKEVGGIAMANNPTETWHYSYGDQMWALYYDKPAALYGVPQIPDELKM